MPKFPCKISSKSVAKNHKAICCDLCGYKPNGSALNAPKKFFYSPP